MDLPALSRVLREHELDEHVAAAERLARPYLRLRATPAGTAPAPGSSYLGGLPDLAAGEPWPEFLDEPLQHVAQICLADISAKLPSHPLPATGHLCFFVNSQGEASNFLEGEERFLAGRVLHVDAPPQSLARAVRKGAQEGGGAAPVFYPPALVSFESALNLPSGTSALGFAAEPDYEQAIGEDDLLLFQVASDPLAQFNWGDAGFLYFVTSHEAVQARDFSKVRIYFELG